MRGRNDAGARSDGGIESAYDFLRVFRGSVDWHFLHRDPVALRLQQPGLPITVMFEVADQDLITGFQVDALGHEVVTLGGIAHDRDLVWERTQHLCGLLSNEIHAALQSS